MYLTATGVISHAGHGRRALLEYLHNPDPRPGRFAITEIDPVTELPYLWTDAGTRCRRIEHLAHLALEEALTGCCSAERNAMSLFLASSTIDLLDRERIYAGHIRQCRDTGATPTEVAFVRPAAGLLAERLARDFGLGGGRFTINTACASGANALLYAREALDRGHCDHALVLGLESPSRITVSGLHGLHTLSPDRSRPFDRRASGMLLGETASAVLVSARPPQGIDDPVRLLGGASACDTGAGPTQTRAPQAAQVMRRALSNTGNAPVKAIKAHGTGTRGNDLAEAEAIGSLNLASVPTSALKGALGHTLGACGVLETLAMAECWQAGFVPPTCGFSQPDPASPLSPLTRPASIGSGRMLLNYFGFAGNNCVLVLERGR